METEIPGADYCVIICTPTYCDKATSRTAGVGFEHQIITGDILGGAMREKFIPVLRIGDRKAAIPPVFSGVIYADFRDDRKFKPSLEELLRTLLNRPRYTPPEKAEKVALLPEQHRSSVFAAELVANMSDWFRLDTNSFAMSLFDLAERDEHLESARLTIFAPQIQELIGHVKLQSAEAPNPDILARQRAKALGRVDKLQPYSD